jgi:hypothetical protein
VERCIKLAKFAVLSFLLLSCASEDVTAPRGSKATVRLDSELESANTPARPENSMVATTAPMREATVSSLATPVLMNASSDLEQFDIPGFLAERQLATSVKDCVLTYVQGPGLESVNQWMVDTGTLSGSSSIEAKIFASTQKALFVCDRDELISERLSELPGDRIPIGEARCVLNFAFDWLATRPDESFLLDPWAFDDQPAHDELQAKLSSCGLEREHVDYLLNPARNPIEIQSDETFSGQ